MRVLGTNHVTTFKKSHAADAGCLAAKIKMLSDSNFNPEKDLDMVNRLGSDNFDRVGSVVVIDACGNNVRIIAKALYTTNPSTLRILKVCTHADYNKIDWS